MPRTPVAMQAAGYLGYLGLLVVVEPVGRRCAPQHERHTRAVVDLYVHGAWHAVSASTAEFAHQLPAEGVRDVRGLRQSVVPGADGGAVRTGRPVRSWACAIPAATSVQSPAQTGSAVHRAIEPRWPGDTFPFLQTQMVVSAFPESCRPDWALMVPFLQTKPSVPAETEKCGVPGETQPAGVRRDPRPARLFSKRRHVPTSRGRFRTSRLLARLHIVQKGSLSLCRSSHLFSPWPMRSRAEYCCII